MLFWLKLRAQILIADPRSGEDHERDALVRRLKEELVTQLEVCICCVLFQVCVQGCDLNVEG